MKWRRQAEVVEREPWKSWVLDLDPTSQQVFELVTKMRGTNQLEVGRVLVLGDDLTAREVSFVFDAARYYAHDLLTRERAEALSWRCQSLRWVMGEEYREIVQCLHRDGHDTRCDFPPPTPVR